MCRKGLTMKTRLAVLLLALLVPAAFVAAHGTADIQKFLKVSDQVATGGQPTPAQFIDLAREGYRTVICLRESAEFDAASEKKAATSRGLVFVSIPVDKENPKPEEVDQFLATLSHPKAFPVFIHCATGNRAAAFWMIRRVVVDKWQVADAEREAKLGGLKSETMKTFALDYIRTHSAK
jgi:uncharacterized protein (TIGR01244 family)